MSTIHEPAYPLQRTESDGFGGHYHTQDLGMTKLEAFTKAALQGLLSSPNTPLQIRAAFGDVTPEGADTVVAGTAIRIAKETLKQLEQENP